MNNILSLGPTVDCLGQYAGSIQHCVPPTLWNPESISTLSDLKVSHLLSVVPYNQTYDKATDTLADFACPVVSKLLPIKDIFYLSEEDATDAAISDPSRLSVGVLELTDLARNLFPAPLNESRPGDVVEWWINATQQDAFNVTLFLGHVAQECWYDYCQSHYISIGNPDIVGYGMFVSIVILLFLTLVFSTLSFSPISRHLRTPRPYSSLRPRRRRFNLRLSLLATLPHLLATTLVFTTSIILSSFVYRWTTHSRFDALMADALSMLCATSVIMLCAAFWATVPDTSPSHSPHSPHPHPHQPWYIPASILLLSILNTVLFSTHFSVFHKPGKVIERLCSRGAAALSSSFTTPSQSFHHSSDFQYFLAGFVAWTLAVVGLVFHYPRLRGMRGRLRGWKYAGWVVAEGMPAVAGMAALAVYARYYWTTRGVMGEVYGRAFLDAVGRWGFGQYLALATWGPPVLGFGWVFLGGEGEEGGERKGSGGEGEGV